MNTMAGAFFLACSNRSRTRDAPTPTYSSTKSEPEIDKNGTPASPATAFAISVLPVPGGPTSSTPLGMRAPICTNFCGFFRNSTISCSSAFSSSAPATSLNVTLFLPSCASFARALPNCIGPAPPPDCLFIMKYQNAPISTTRMRYGRNCAHHGIVVVM